MNYQKLPILLLILFMFSCKNDNFSSVEKTHYIDLKNLIKHHIAVLDSIKPVIKKTISVNSKIEKKRIYNHDWKNELLVFAESDINKTAWVGFFKDSIIFDSSSPKNKIQLYLNKSKNNHIPVQILRVEFDSNNQVQQINITIENKNNLYFSSQELEMVISNGKINEYKIHGRQKMIFGEMREYNITSELIY